MRSDVIELVTVTRTQNDIGAWAETVTRRQVMCKVESVTRAEFFDAAQTGLKPEYRFTVFAGDYTGELEAVYNGTVYSIYRTYHGTGDQVELYVESKAGVTHGQG